MAVPPLLRHMSMVIIVTEIILYIAESQPLEEEVRSSLTDTPNERSSPCAVLHHSASRQRVRKSEVPRYERERERM